MIADFWWWLSMFWNSKIDIFCKYSFYTNFCAQTSTITILNSDWKLKIEINVSFRNYFTSCSRVFWWKMNMVHIITCCPRSNVLKWKASRRSKTSNLTSVSCSWIAGSTLSFKMSQIISEMKGQRFRTHWKRRGVNHLNIQRRRFLKFSKGFLPEPYETSELL